MSDLVIPNFGALLGEFIGQVPTGTMPRFLALLERTAADRFRGWAEAAWSPAPHRPGSPSG
jgi:hypothetical protein